MSSSCESSPSALTDPPFVVNESLEPATAIHELIEYHLKQLQDELTPQKASECCTTLIKIFWNILNNPSDMKFRSLRKGNKAISTKLCGPCRPVLSLMLVVGFQDDDESYIFPKHADLTAMMGALEALQMVALDLESRVAELSANSVGEIVASSSSGQICTPSRTGSDRVCSKPKNAFSFQLQGKNTNKANTSMRSEDDFETLRKMRAEKFEATKASENTGELPNNVMLRFSPGDCGMTFSDGGVVMSVSTDGQAAAHGVRPGWIIMRIAEQEIDPNLPKHIIIQLITQASIGSADYIITFKANNDKAPLTTSSESWSLETVTEHLAGYGKTLGDSVRLAPSQGDVRTLKF